MSELRLSVQLPTVAVTSPAGTQRPAYLEPASPGLPPEHLDFPRNEHNQRLDLRTLMRGKRHIRTEVRAHVDQSN